MVDRRDDGVIETGTYAQRLRCSRCGKPVSTEFYAVPTDTPDRGLIVRAWIECPECMAEKPDP